MALHDLELLIPRDRGANQLNELTARHQEILRLSAQRWTNTDIAEHLDVCVATVTKTLNCELGVARSAELQSTEDEITQESLRKLKELLPQCVDVYEALLKGERKAGSEISPSLQLRAAGEVMDRAGIPKETKTKATGDAGYFGRIDGAGLAERAMALGYINPAKVIDAEVVQPSVAVPSGA